MLISCAIRSRTTAVGVGFLLNSSSRVTSWSCVALWRFWFFCCWVSVLFRGGRRETELVWVGVTAGPGETEGVAAMLGTSCTVVILQETCWPRKGVGVLQLPTELCRRWWFLGLVLVLVERRWC